MVGAGLAEQPDQFLLLGVDADHRPALLGLLGAESGDTLELPIAVGMLGAGETLTVDPQRGALLLEPAADGRLAEGEALASECGGEFDGRPADPAQAAHGIAGRLLFQQNPQPFGQRGLFFYGLAATAGAAHPLRIDLARDHFPVPLAHGLGM